MFSFTAVRCVPIGRKKPYQFVTFGPPVSAADGAADAKQAKGDAVVARYTQFDRPTLGASASVAAQSERDGTPSAGPCRVSELLINGPPAATASSSAADPLQKADSPRPRWEKEYGRRFGYVSASRDGQWVLLVRRYTELWMWHVRTATLTSVGAVVDEDRPAKGPGGSRRNSKVAAPPASAGATAAAAAAAAPAVPDAPHKWRVLQATLSHDASTALWLVAPAASSSSTSSASSSGPSHPPSPLTYPSAAAAAARTRALLWYRGSSLSAESPSSSSASASGVSDAHTRSLLRALELDAGSCLVVPALELARAGMRLDDPLALAFGSTSVTPYCNSVNGNGWIVSQCWLSMSGDAAAGMPTYPHHAQCIVIAQLRIALDIEPIEPAVGSADVNAAPPPRCRVTYWPYSLCVHPLLPPQPASSQQQPPPVCLFGTVAHSAVFRDRCVLMRWDHTGNTLAVAINTWNAAGARVLSFLFRPPRYAASSIAGVNEVPVQRMTEHVHYASTSLALDVSNEAVAASRDRSDSHDIAAGATSPSSRASEPPTPRGPAPADVSSLSSSPVASSAAASSATAASAVPPWWVADLSWWPAGTCACSASSSSSSAALHGPTPVQPCSVVMCDGRVLTVLLHGHGREGSRLLDVALLTRGLLRAAPKATAPKHKHALALAATPDALPKRAIAHHMLPPNPAHPQLSERRYSLSVALPSAASVVGRLLLSDGFVVAEYTLSAPTAADYFTAQLQAAMIHPLALPLPAVMDVWRASVATVTGFANGPALTGTSASLFGALLVALLHYTDVAASSSSAVTSPSAASSAAVVNTSAVVWSGTSGASAGAAAAVASVGGTPPLSSQTLRERKQQQLGQSQPLTLTLGSSSAAAAAIAAPLWVVTEQLVTALTGAATLNWSAPGGAVHEPTVQLVVEVVDRLLVHAAAAFDAATRAVASPAVVSPKGPQEAAAAAYRCLRLAEAALACAANAGPADARPSYSFDDQWLALHTLLVRITPALILNLDPFVTAVTGELQARGLVAVCPTAIAEPARVLSPLSPSRAAAREKRALHESAPSPLWIEARALYHAGRWAECEHVIEQLGDAYVWALLPVYLHSHRPHKLVELAYRIMGTCTRPSRGLMTLPPANFFTSADQLATAAMGVDADTPLTRQWGPILAVLSVGRALAAYFTGQPLKFRAPTATCPDTLHAVVAEPTPLQCVDFRWRVCVEMVRATPLPPSSPSKYPPSAASAPFASSQGPTSPTNKNMNGGNAGGWWTVTRCVDCLLWCHMDSVATTLLPPALKNFIAAAASTARADANANPARNWLAFHRVDRDLKLPAFPDYAPDFAVRAQYTRDELARQEMARRKADDAARKHADAQQLLLRTPLKASSSGAQGPLLSPNRVSQGTQTPPAARVPPSLWVDPAGAAAVLPPGSPTRLVAEGTDAPDWDNELPLDIAASSGVPHMVLPPKGTNKFLPATEEAVTCLGAVEIGALAGCAYCAAIVQAGSQQQQQAAESKYGRAPSDAGFIASVEEIPAPAAVQGNISHVTVFVPPSALPKAPPAVTVAVPPAVVAPEPRPQEVVAPAHAAADQSATHPALLQPQSQLSTDAAVAPSAGPKVLSERSARRMGNAKKREQWLHDADDAELERQRAALEATQQRIEQIAKERREQAARLHHTQQAAAGQLPPQPNGAPANVWSGARGNTAVRGAEPVPAAPRDARSAPPDESAPRNSRRGKGAAPATVPDSGRSSSGRSSSRRSQPSSGQQPVADGNLWGSTKSKPQLQAIDRRGSAPSNGGGAIWSASGVGTRTTAPPQQAQSQYQPAPHSSKSSGRSAAPPSMPGTSADVRLLSSASIPQFAAVTTDRAMGLRVDTGHPRNGARGGVASAKPVPFQPLPDDDRVNGGGGGGPIVLVTQPTTAAWARVEAANNAPPGAAVNGQAWSSSVGPQANVRPPQQRPSIPPLVMPSSGNADAPRQVQPSASSGTTSHTLAVPLTAGGGSARLGGTTGADSVWDVSEMGDASTHPLAGRTASAAPAGGANGGSNGADATGDMSVMSGGALGAADDDANLSGSPSPPPTAPHAGRSAAPPPTTTEPARKGSVKMSAASKLIAAALANGAPPVGARGFRRSFAPLPDAAEPVVTSLDRQDAYDAQRRTQRAERTRMEEAARKLRADVAQGVGNYDEFQAALQATEASEQLHPHAGRGTGPLSFTRIDGAPQRAKAGAGAGSNDGVLRPEPLPATDDTPAVPPLRHVLKPSLKPGLRKPPRSLSLNSGSPSRGAGATSQQPQPESALVRFVLPQHQMLYPHVDDEFGPDSDRGHASAAAAGVSPTAGDEKAPESLGRRPAPGKRGSAPPQQQQPARIAEADKQRLPEYVSRADAGPIAQAMFFIDPKLMRAVTSGAPLPEPVPVAPVGVTAKGTAPAPVQPASAPASAADVKHSPTPAAPAAAASVPSSRVLDELPGTEPAPPVQLTASEQRALARQNAHEASGATVDTQLAQHAARNAPAVRAALAHHPFHPPLPERLGSNLGGDGHSPTRRASGPWPAQLPLRHELRAVDADLTALERRASDIRAQLRILPADTPDSPQHKRVAADAAAHDQDTLVVGKKLLSQLDALLTESGDDADATAAAAAAAAAAAGPVPSEHQRLAAEVARTLADVAEDSNSFDG